MELKTFAGVILEGIRNKLDDLDNISVISSVKNNGIEFTGIMFQNKDENISPTIYIDDLYEDYRRNQIPIPEIVDEVIDRYTKTTEGIHDICNLSVDYNMCKEKIIYRLVSAEKNKQLLKNMPYIPFLDLAITFHLVVAMNEEYMQSMKICNDLQEKWHVSVEELFKMARKNTKELLPPEIRELKQMVSDYKNSAGLQKEPSGIEAIDQGKIDMIVVTNELGINGAAVMLYDGVIEKLAEKFASDLYVLPSSIHEMIVVPAYDSDRALYEPLSVMVKSINQEYVEKEEVLSDRVYIYVRDEKKFR